MRELLEKRAALVAQSRGLIEKADTEKRSMNAEEQAHFDKIMSEVDSLTAEIDRREKQDAAAKFATPILPRDTRDNSPEAVEKRRSASFDRYIRHNRFNPCFTADDEAELRTTVTTSGTTTGLAYTVPQGFLNVLDKAMLAYGGMLGAGTVLRDSSGNKMYLPTWNDTANTGAQITETSALSATGGTPPTFGREELDAYIQKTDILRVTWAALQDSAFDIQSLLASALGERLGRLLNAAFTTGTGSTAPEGIVTGATSGKTAASSSALTWTEMLDLYHSVDPSYRVGPKVMWMFNDSTFKVLRQMKDGEGRFLWEPGITAGEPSTIWGKPYMVNQQVASIGSGTKPVVFGDFSKFVIRLVGSPALVRLEELYAQTMETGFFVWQRVDSVLVDAGTNPVRYITMAS